jgi:hypothetical protein
MINPDDLAATAKERVQYDIEHGFREKLSSRDDARFGFGLHGSTIDDDDALLTSDHLVVVPWRFPCTHTGLFLDIPATGVDLELRGTTFIDIRDPGAWTYHRYIDFIGALHQIGASYDVRPVAADLVEAEEDADTPG